MKSEIIQARLAEAKKRHAELEEKIREAGGLVMLGLYHGERRVRARYDRFSLREGWKLSATETDLINAIGIDKISSKVHEPDLKKKYGLVIKEEIAPVTIEISEIGSVDIERTDEWGEGAMPYINKTPMYKRYFVGIGYKWLIAMVVFFPAVLVMLFSEKVTLLTNQVILGVLFLSALIVPIWVGPFHLKGSDEVIVSFLGLYISICLLPLIATVATKQTF